MKKFSSKLKILFIPLVILAFFIPHLVKLEFPIPADSLVGLYHPWRDNSYLGYSPLKFKIKNPILTDPVLQTYPWRQGIVKEFKNLTLPLWNPYSFSGQPLLANIQSAPLQFQNIFFFILPFKFAWSANIILSQILLGTFMFLFLKNLKITTISSVFASIVLPFSGFFMPWMTWGTIVTTAMWLPLILFSIDKIASGTKPLFFLILTLSFFQVLVSGHLQTALYVFLAVFIYLAFKIPKANSFKPIFLIIFSAFCGILIASPQLLPTLEFINLSNRTFDQGYFPGRQDWFLPAQNLIQIVAPDFFGNPATYNYWGVWNYIEFVSFVGIFPLGFALFSILRPAKGKAYFLLLGTVALLMALENPISKIPYELKLPLFSSMQPSRIIFLLIFSLVSLCAYGLDEFLKVGKKKILGLLSPVIIVFFTLLLILATQFLRLRFPYNLSLDPAGIALRNLAIPFLTASILFVIFVINHLNLLNKKILITLIFTLTIFELFRFSYKLTPFSKNEIVFPQTATTNFLRNQQKPYRTMVTDRIVMHPNTQTPYEIESVDGYDPLYLKNYGKFVSSWQSGKVQNGSSFNRIVTPTNFRAHLTDFLNVKYIISIEEISDPKLTKIFEEGQTKVYFNNKALPRAYFVQEIKKTQNEDEEMQSLIDPGTDLSKVGFSSDFEFPITDEAGTAEITNYSAQSFEIQTESNEALPLIVSNTFYPGWEAYVDGVKTQIKKTNFMFQGVIVPAGNHKLYFKFTSASFSLGLKLSLIGLMSTILISFYIWRTKSQS